MSNIGFDKDFLWLFRKVGSAAICCTLDYRIIELTPLAEELFGVFIEDARNAPIASIFSPLSLKISFYDDKDPVVNMFDDQKAKFCNKAQKILNMSWRARPRTNLRGKIVGFIIYAEEYADIECSFQDHKIATERSEAAHKSIREEQTQRTEKWVAEKTSLFMQILAGSLAHEIRTPLAIIGINLDLLEIAKKNKAKIDDEGKYLTTIRYAVKLGASIIDNILTILKTLSSEGGIGARFEPLSIRECVNDVISTYPFLDQEKSLVTIEGSNDFIYRGDRILTQHVLFNLFKNALRSIKEIEKGEIKIKFELGKKHNILRFIDTAGGIAAEDLPRIFDQFETKVVGYSGLGLAFCKIVMRSYGGDITCKAEKNKYAEFILSFPLGITSI